MLVLGIDPGSSGGLVIVQKNINALPEIILAIRMPTIKITTPNISNDTKSAMVVMKNNGEVLT